MKPSGYLEKEEDKDRRSKRTTWVLLRALGALEHRK